MGQTITAKASGKNIGKLMSENLLFAGPWVGEFGWELFCWQAFVRKEARKYERVVVASRPDMEYLYSDFCNEFVPHVPNSKETDMYRCKGFVYDGLHERYGGRWLCPFRRNVLGYVPIRKAPDIFRTRQRFVRYGNDTGNSGVLLHARSTTKADTGCRNWPLEKWIELTELIGGYKLVSIGAKDGALHVPGTLDCRGVGLEQLANMMCGCVMVVGSSSGPMHFASLCGAPHLVWTGTQYNVRKYKADWNPFDTKVFILSHSWNPEVGIVYDAFRSLLSLSS